MGKLQNKVAIITGSSSGIGYAAAVMFASEGASLVLTGRNMDNLTKIADLVRDASKDGQKDPLIIQADMLKEDDVNSIMEKTLKYFDNRLDILVNNAGIVEKGSILNTSMEQFDRVMTVNMRSIYQLTMLAVPHLIKTEGTIVNVSSVNGMRSFPGVLSYNISKAALDQFTRCTALELASKKVRVNSVNPGVIQTEIHKRGGMDEKEYEAFLEHSKTTHALGRTGHVDEVAKAILYLASSDSSFTTGISLPVDGGRHAMCPR